MKEFEREFEWIDRYFKPLAHDDEAYTSFNLSDDGALLDGHVVVTDSLFEGTHFLANDDPEQVARLLSRVNVSDCAAMGARPLCYWLNVGVPRVSAQRWMEALARGLAHGAKNLRHDSDGRRLRRGVTACGTLHDAGGASGGARCAPQWGAAR